MSKSKRKTIATDKANNLQRPCSPSELLYDRSHSKCEVFKMQINGGGDLGVAERGFVEIHFVNGKFRRCDFPFVGPYSRNAWRILSAIEAEISLIESRMANNGGQIPPR